MKENQNHMRFFPKKDGFHQIFFIVKDNILGLSLEETFLPEYIIQYWEKYINNINDRIPYEYEVNSFIENFLSNEL